MWFLPKRRGLKPNYGSHQFSDADFVDVWRTIAQDAAAKDQAAPVQIQQDVQLQVRTFAKEPKAVRTIGPGRKGYLVCIHGDLSIRAGLQEIQLRQHDAARIQGPATLEFEANEHSQVLWVDSIGV